MDVNFSKCLTASENLRIPFHDVDPADMVWHGRYLKYFEVARSLLLEDLDYSYDAMKASGFIWPVVDVAIRYVRPLKLGQEIIVTACLREWEMRLVVDYRIDDQAGAMYTKARTIQVPVNSMTNELVLGSPEIFIDKVKNSLARAFPGSD
jgi:acyl-CoA thioester hydrolase